MKKSSTWKLRRVSAFLLALALTLMPGAAEAVNSWGGLVTAVSAGGSGNVTLTGDIPGTTQLTIERSLTLDLAGNDLTITIPWNANANAININPSFHLTIIDSVGGGVLYANASGALPTAGNGAGINVTGATLTINSGNVTARGGNNSAGIGGGFGGTNGTVNINGGVINAFAGTNSAGIGGGSGPASGGIINISGNANVTAIASSAGGGGAGIGGGGTGTGSGGSGGQITISGNPTVNATGTGGSAGIGGGGAHNFGPGGSSGDITISGGNITANGSGGAPGIGPGRLAPNIPGPVDSIDITGGNITSTGTLIPRPTPTVSIDFINETLTGFGAFPHNVNGSAVTITSGTTNINAAWLGSTIAIVALGDNITWGNSTAQNLPIPSRPAAPTGLTGVAPSTFGGSNGSITGVTTAMEWRALPSGTWANVGGTTIPNLTAGNYEVRVRAVASANFTGVVATVTVPAGEIPSASIATTTIDNTGGDVVIMLSNDTFAATLNNTASWITNLPAGMSQNATRINATQVIINITGTPTAASTEQIAITIPAASLVASTSDLTVTSNPSAVFATATPITFSGVTANSTSGTTTTMLTLNFSADPATLAIGNISISGGVTAANLQGTGNSRTINISGNWADGQQVTVTLTSPLGFNITPPSRPVTLHRNIYVSGGDDNDGDDDYYYYYGEDGTRRRSRWRRHGCDAGMGFGALALVMLFAVRRRE